MYIIQCMTLLVWDIKRENVHVYYVLNKYEQD